MKLPEHITIIMDGNGRWARQRGKERLIGHNAGADSVRACCEYAVEKGIRYLSLFAFSEENWNRPESEIQGLMALMIKSIVEEEPVFLKNNIRFRVIGDMERLSQELLDRIGECERNTEHCTGLTLIIFLSYSGKWDLCRTMNILMEKYRGTDHVITPEDIASNLSTAGIPDPDLMIRTSGEQRISNYMLWQCAYTEFYFTDVLWPDFRKADLERAIESYSTRERRFGKTGEQIK